MRAKFCSWRPRLLNSEHFECVPSSVESIV
jgi:hypothetical protein